MLESCWRMLVASKRVTRVGNSYGRLLPAPTSTNQHLLVAACRRVEDLAMVHFAPSGRSGALGLRIALRFAGLLTQEGTVPARPY